MNKKEIERFKKQAQNMAPRIVRAIIKKEDMSLTKEDYEFFIIAVLPKQSNEKFETRFNRVEYFLKELRKNFYKMGFQMLESGEENRRFIQAMFVEYISVYLKGKLYVTVAITQTGLETIEYH